MTWANIYFLNGGLRKVVVTFFQCVKLIFLTTHERTFQPTLRGVEKLVSKWGQGVVETELNSAVARFFQSMLGIRKKQQLFRFLLRKSHYNTRIKIQSHFSINSIFFSLSYIPNFYNLSLVPLAPLAPLAPPRPESWCLLDM
jgi:hypothetical protein